MGSSIWDNYNDGVVNLLEEYSKLHFVMELPIPMVTVNKLLSIHYRTRKSIRDLVLLATDSIYKYGNVVVEDKDSSKSRICGHYIGLESLKRHFPYDEYLKFIRSSKGRVPKGYGIPDKPKPFGEEYEFIIKVVEKRKRLADIDGSSYKYLIDSLRYLGIIYDDNPKYMKYVFKKQEKSKEESTIISVWRKSYEWRAEVWT